MNNHSAVSEIKHHAKEFALLIEGEHLNRNSRVLCSKAAGGLVQRDQMANIQRWPRNLKGWQRLDILISHGKQIVLDTLVLIR